MKHVIGRLCLVSLALSRASGANADIYHYHNVVMGDRAMGLGGAYCAVADDASGIVYNPAGLAFALSNDISGSANAFYNKTVEYKKTIGTNSFKEYSKGQVAPFFGGLQKLDHVLPGMAAAFGIYVTDSDLKDQNDEIKTGSIESFHRTVNLRASTNNFAAAVAKRISSSFSVGFGLNFLSVDELVQEYQDARVIVNSSGIRQNLTQNIRQRLLVSGLEPSLGLQWSLGGRFSVGLMARKAMILTQKFENSIERNIIFTDAANNIITDEQDETENGSFGNGKLLRVDAEADEENPVGDWPAEIRAGAAWFATTRLLWTFDVIHRTAVDGDQDLFDREAVTNFATGIEYYVTASVPLRLGAFTNYDSRPAIVPGLKNQRDHIDWMGFSTFLGWAQPNSQLGLGYVGQIAKGEAQKVAGVTTVQEVTGISSTVAFSATHSF